MQHIIFYVQVHVCCSPVTRNTRPLADSETVCVLWYLHRRGSATWQTNEGSGGRTHSRQKQGDLEQNPQHIRRFLQFF